MTAHIVWDWAADCSRLVILLRQRSCSKTAARPTDNDCLSVGRMQLSDTGVGDELTVVGQVTRALPDKDRWTRVAILNTTRCRAKPVQLAEHRRDMIASPGARHESDGSILNWWQAARQFVGDAIPQRVAVVQAIDNKLDRRLRGVFRRAPNDWPKLSQLVVTACVTVSRCLWLLQQHGQTLTFRYRSSAIFIKLEAQLSQRGRAMFHVVKTLAKSINQSINEISIAPPTKRGRRRLTM